MEQKKGAILPLYLEIDTGSVFEKLYLFFEVGSIFLTAVFFLSKAPGY
jgi:hypothetical protein